MSPLRILEALGNCVFKSRIQNERTRKTLKSSLQGQETTPFGIFRRAGINEEESARPAVEPYPETMEGH